MNGGIVYRSEAKNQNSEIDLSDQPKGIYLLKVQTGIIIRTGKIIIQ